MNTRALLVLGMILGPTLQMQAQPCNFKGYSTFRMSDFVESVTTKKVMPTYPEEAKRLGLSGRIYVRILINASGSVEKACVDPKRSSTSESTLVQAAQNAAKKWTFVPNFGFPRVPKGLKGKYLEDVLIFNFGPKHHEQGKETDRKNSADQR